jgi:hypothetical protein
MRPLNFLIGIRNADGSLTLVPGNPTGNFCPAELLPHLLKYKGEEAVRAYLKRYAKSLKKLKGLFSDEQLTFNVPDVFRLPEALDNVGISVASGYMYVWVASSPDGEWVICEINENSRGKTELFDSDGGMFISIYERLYEPAPEWFEANWHPPKPVSPVIPLKPRLSKEDWLRKNYPEMQELPKWRFPGVAAG